MSTKYKRPLFWALAIALCGLTVYLLTRYKAAPQADMVAVYRANNRGVGLMEQFKYDQAAAAFDEVTRLAPEWTPGWINLGIALLNNQGLTETQQKGSGQSDQERARALFGNLLKKDPQNAYAHYCLGILHHDQGQMEEAAKHFEAVTHIDPNDGHAWYFLGRDLPEESERSLDCMRRAVKLDPYLSGALYGLAMKLRASDPDQAKKLLEAYRDLYEIAKWDSPVGLKYSEMGKYAEVIGRPERSATIAGMRPLFAPADSLKVALKEGARWARTADFGAEAEFQALLRTRCGGTIILFDYDRDDRPDVLFLGAVVEGGRVRDLLLHNEGEGKLRDVTAEAGLSGSSLGGAVADFDNDGHRNLFLTGVGKQRLLRNTGKGAFEDVTSQAGLGKVNTVCLGAGFLDLDQDGDLDLLVAQFASSLAEAVALLKDDKATGQAGLAVYLNVGEAPAVRPTQDPPPLKPSFRLHEGPWPETATVNISYGDFDQDRDLDFLVLPKDGVPSLILNDRLLRFTPTKLAESLAGRWNGGLALDVNRDGRSDLFLLGPGQKQAILLSKSFEPGANNSPPLLQAQAIDLDYDGTTDVVGLSADRVPVFLQNDGQRLAHRPEYFGQDSEWPKDILAVAVADVDGNKYPDLLFWSEAAGLHMRANTGNNNYALKLELSGHRRADGNNLLRCNADGIGAWAMAQADDFWTCVENATLSGGLGHSRLPLVLGMSRYSQADIVRVRWPDNTVQAEFGLAACRVLRIDESNRKPGSCPVLFAWNGQRFGFITDFLGAGTVGEYQPDGSTRPPRPEESVKIEPEQLAARDGEYVLKIAQPMNEIVYLDKVELLAIDHPADVRIYPDERFGGAPPTQELLAFRAHIFPVRARDQRGRDVLPKLLHWDRNMVDAFARRTWLGLAEEHRLELDFEDRLSHFKTKDRLILCLAGWTDYAWPESIWAATQAGVAIQAPILERLSDDGTWQTLLADVGFPAGLPRMMTVDVTGKLGGDRCVVRLRTNLNVYWDQVFVAPILGTQYSVLSTEIKQASLTVRGFVQEFSPDGRQPTLYDYDRLEQVPVSRTSGKLTRVGDVSELLQAVDDRFVIFGPGEEVTVRLDARGLPALSPGWKRSFVLKTCGYCKDTGPFTATGDSIEPIPFRGMSKYPYGANEHYPHRDCLEKYNTR